jgi:CheY-like chemotaxis protein
MKLHNSIQGKKILIAESNDMNFSVLEKLFSHSGLKVIRAYNGKEFVSMSSKGIDVLLIDLSMPMRDGISATMQIKSKLPNLPIIAQTSGNEFIANGLQGIHSEFDTYISKPINKEQLFSEIEKHLISQPVCV